MVQFQMEDVCANCGHEYGEHFRDGCPTKGSTTTTFRKALQLKECKVGDQVRLLGDDDKRIGTICSFKDPLLPGLEVLIGWRAGEQPAYAWSINDTVPEYKSLIYPFPHGYWLLGDTLVAEVVNSSPVHATIKRAGMKCAARYCGTYNAFAEPNQPDGNYICFSCRQSGHEAP